MSFSSRTKNELARIMPNKHCCQMAELLGLIRSEGTLQIKGANKIAISVVTENAAVARKIFRLLKEIFSLETEISLYRKNKLKKNLVYSVGIPYQPEVKALFKLLGLWSEKGEWDLDFADKFPAEIVQNKCCIRAYLRGVFLGVGSMSDPEGHYHLEMIFNSEQVAGKMAQMIEEFGIKGKIIERKNSYVYYLKESEQIVDFLNVIGAHKALLDFENIRIMKEIRNNVNRLVNCETANLNKTVEAALRQVEAIRTIQASIGIENLPDNLQEIAKMRLSYPDISLKELGEKMQPPLGKSGINHRMRRIEKLAEEIKGEK